MELGHGQFGWILSIPASCKMKLPTFVDAAPSVHTVIPHVFLNSLDFPLGACPYAIRIDTASGHLRYVSDRPLVAGNRFS